MAFHESQPASVYTALPRPHPPPPPPKPNLANRTSTPQTPIYVSSPPLPPVSQQDNTASPRPQPPLPPPTNQTLASVPAQIPPFPPGQLPQIQPPSLEAQWLPDSLRPKTTAELAPILQNSQLLTSLAQSHPSYAAATAQLSSAIQANVDLAQQLSGLESQVQQCRSQVAQLLLQHTTLSTQWRRKQSEMDDALSPWGPRAMYQRLVSSIGEQEALIRAVQESFLDGGGDEGYGGAPGSGKASDKEVGEWIRRIREGTTTLEKRQETRARWDEGRVGGWR